MKLTKLDFLIILLVVASVVVGLTQERYFRVKGNNIYGTVMTHRTLVKRGYQSNATIKGIDMQDHKFKKLNGIIIDTKPDRIYFSTRNKTWLILPSKTDKEDVEDLENSAFRLLQTSSIYLEPTKSFKVTDSCGEDSYISGKFYYELEGPANEVTCEFLTSKLIDRYGGKITCKHAADRLILNTKYMKFNGDIGSVIWRINNSVTKSITISKQCKTIVK